MRFDACDLIFGLGVLLGASSVDNVADVGPG